MSTLEQDWQQVKNSMSSTTGVTYQQSNPYFNTTTGSTLNITSIGVDSGYPLVGTTQWTGSNVTVLQPPPVEVKPETHAEWLRLRTDEMCREGREALEAA